jgi:hypothetical protein
MASSVNREELAWAAGFFDGEGCATLNVSGPKKYRRASLVVVQSGDHAVSLLERFQAAVFGVGAIYVEKPRPGRLQKYRWQTAKFASVQAVCAALWQFLGPAKRAKIKFCLPQMRHGRTHRRVPVILGGCGRCGKVCDRLGKYECSRCRLKSAHGDRIRYARNKMRNGAQSIGGELLWPK